MGKGLVGHHLMRVRIRKNIYEKLEEVADEESDRTGDHVTVSDLVRAACYNYLLVNEALRRLENSQPLGFELADEAVLIVKKPML